MNPFPTAASAAAAGAAGAVPGLWHNFGDSTPIDTQRALLRTAFDLGINHFDLANNYGPPYGSAEINFGRLLREDFKPTATS
jgi:L-glyceraldehyde 3-phosphate reductase